MLIWVVEFGYGVFGSYYVVDFMLGFFLWVSMLVCVVYLVVCVSMLFGDLFVFFGKVGLVLNCLKVSDLFGYVDYDLFVWLMFGGGLEYKFIF